MIKRLLNDGHIYSIGELYVDLDMTKTNIRIELDRMVREKVVRVVRYENIKGYQLI